MARFRMGQKIRCVVIESPTMIKHREQLGGGYGTSTMQVGDVFTITGESYSSHEYAMIGMISERDKHHNSYFRDHFVPLESRKAPDIPEMVMIGGKKRV